MRYGLSEEQQMLSETARRLVEQSFPRDVVWAFTRQRRLSPGWSRQLADVGLFGVCAREAFGGLELGAVEALALSIEAGKGLLPYPLIEAIVAASYLGEAGDDRAAAIVAGETIPAIAWNATAAVSGSALVLEGDLGLVSWADACDLILVPLAGKDVVALVGPHQSGVKVEAMTSFDKTSTVARVRLSGCEIAERDLIVHSFGRARQLATILATAELFGAAKSAFDLTVAYVKQREQFGQPIGRYQAIKHILADDALRLESMEVALLYAGWALDASAEDRDVAVHVAKAYASDGAHLVVEDAIQCHGGIGFTWEYGLHFNLRRVGRLARILGTARDHREAIAAHMIGKAAGAAPAEAA